jgi:hypothetical protein
LKARTLEARARQVGAETPRLIEHSAVELGAGELGVVEARRLQVGAAEVEPGQVEPVEALSGEVGCAGLARGGERGLDLGTRHLGFGELVRLEVEILDHILRAGTRRGGEHGQRRKYRCNEGGRLHRGVSLAPRSRNARAPASSVPRRAAGPNHMFGTEPGMTRG